MVFKVQAVLPYAASTAASAAIFVLCTKSKDTIFEYFKSCSSCDLLKVALGLVCCCYCIQKLCFYCKKLLIRKLLDYRGWLYAPRSRSTKVWGSLLHMLIGKDPPLNTLQEYLPKYPLPKLEDTCKKTLTTYRPLLTDEEYNNFEVLVNKLQNVEGPPLQNFLKKRYDEETNWLTPLWDKYAYLAGRSSIAINSNFGGLGDRSLDYVPSIVKRTAIAANMIYLTLEYKDRMESGKVTHMRIQNTVPICCNRYKYMLSTTRIPQRGVDQLCLFENSDHIAVFYKGSIYKVCVYATNPHGKKTPLLAREIQSQLDQIVDDEHHDRSECTKVNPAIFTTINRNDWSEIREALKKNPMNARSLDIIEKSILCMSLTDQSPKNPTEELWEALCGNGFDHWFDKSLHVLIHQNNRTSYNVEHTTAEATLTGRWWEYVHTFYINYDSQGNADAPVTYGFPLHHDEVPQPELLEWQLNEFLDKISTARKTWQERSADLDVCVNFTKEGKETIKKLRVSPDGFFQLVLQLAFYRLHHTTPKTYETAATRLFLHARTETIRPTSLHSVAFTKKMDDPEIKNEEKKNHLKAAIKHQTKYKLDAMCGLGVDRHLFGLYVAGLLNGKVPQLFTQPPLCESDQLSTSQSPLRYDPVFGKGALTDAIGGGFGPQRHDGYGISYFFSDYDTVNILCTSYRSHPETGSLKFCEAVKTAFDDMATLLRTND